MFDLDKERAPYICEALMLGEIPESTLDDERECVDYGPRKTPLLVDELAKETQWLLQWAESNLPLLEACCPEVWEAPDLVQKDRQRFAEARQVLSRYQKEVGDA